MMIEKIVRAFILFDFSFTINYDIGSFQETDDLKSGTISSSSIVPCN